MKLIILTGATGGLGSALAETLADEDADLICMYRNPEKFEKVLGKLKERITGYLLKEEEDYSALEEMIRLKNYESITLILNAFSIAPIKRVGDFTTEEIKGSVGGNITGNLLLLNRVVGFCKRSSLGLRIINLDSGAADFPLTGWGNYCAGKAFINSFLSVIGKENPEMQVVSFDPGVMDTQMQEQIRSVKEEVFDQVNTFIGYKKDHRLHAPLDVAKQIKERYVSVWSAKDLREEMK